MRHETRCFLSKYQVVVGGCPPPVAKDCLYDLLLVFNIVGPFLTSGDLSHRTKVAQNVSFCRKLFEYELFSQVYLL